MSGVWRVPAPRVARSTVALAVYVTDKLLKKTLDTVVRGGYDRAKCTSCHDREDSPTSIRFTGGSPWHVQIDLTRRGHNTRATGQTKEGGREGRKEGRENWPGKQVRLRSWSLTTPGSADSEGRLGPLFELEVFLADPPGQRATTIVLRTPSGKTTLDTTREVAYTRPPDSAVGSIGRIHVQRPPAFKPGFHYLDLHIDGIHVLTTPVEIGPDQSGSCQPWVTCRYEYDASGNRVVYAQTIDFNLAESDPQSLSQTTDAEDVQRSDNKSEDQS